MVITEAWARLWPRGERFGGWPAVPQAFRKFTEGKREWRDVLEVLSVAKRNKQVAARGRSRRSMKARKVRCWRHNWPDYPEHIEVVELCSFVKSLTEQ